MPDPHTTPAMQQYRRFKKAHPGCVLLFRMGDFYEMFDDDAVTVSKAIGLTLTQRTAGVPMAGVPYHQLENYLKRLVARGFRVAVCDQLIDASQAKGIVPRGVTRVITPGTLVDESLLEGGASSAVAAVVLDDGPGTGKRAAAAIAEVSTGEFVVVECAADALADDMLRRGVREVLWAEGAPGESAAPPAIGRVIRALGVSGIARPGWHFRGAEAGEALRTHFGVATLAGFGLNEDGPATQACGALLRYLQETQTLAEEDRAGHGTSVIPRATLRHLRPPRREQPDDALIIDAVSLRSLEVERTLRGTGDALEGTLLGVFLGAGVGKGAARTAPGRRLLREWLCRPSRDRGVIEARQACVATLHEDRTLADRLGEVLGGVQDVARISARLSLGRATPRDVVALAQSLSACGAITDLLANSPSMQGHRADLSGVVGELAPIAAEIVRVCVEAPPPHMREGGLFREGVDAALDEARLLQRDAGTWLAQYQARLVQQHNLPNLKVGFNKIFGYYIELPQAQARQAPAELKRTQTLRNAERYTTPELREFEHKVTTAESRALEREKELFAGLCERAGERTQAIAVFARCVAELDVLLAFADKAAHRRWTRPAIAEEPVLAITQGRHPVLEETLGSECVPNDCVLGRRDEETRRRRDEADTTDESDTSSLGLCVSASLALITGPNMAGKSTYIRQVALITLLAHAGSFVPAEAATIGLTDRIFTRIGADDALHAGQSTFMVEMIETANILHHATHQSLVVLDEVGRGTSTLDGLSLAWAVVEHLAGTGVQVSRCQGVEGEADSVGLTPRHLETSSPFPSGPRTLFATHYHELTDLEERLPGRVQNLHVAVREWPAGGEHAEIVFLHRILPGRTDQSYGLHVARLAGMPGGVIGRARDVLKSLAVHQDVGSESDSRQATSDKSPPSQLSPSHRLTVSPYRRNVARIANPLPPEADDGQLALFREFLPHPAVDALQEIKLEQMTPMEAFDALRKLRELLD